MTRRERRPAPPVWDYLTPDAVEIPEGRDPDGIVLTFPVTPELSGMRLDRFIQTRIPRLSRTKAQHVVRTCAIHLDGRGRRPSDTVRAGETVVLIRERFVEPEVPREFRVVHEDPWLLAISKPAGLPMHRTATYHRNTLSYLLKERYGTEGGPRMVHRLDRETSGLVLCAKDRTSERVLGGHFEHHRVQKQYLAIVRGVPEPRRGVIELPLARVEQGLHLCMEVRPDGLPALTHYRVRAVRGDYALVQLFPKTGRQHQLRVHLSAIGHPIVGDKLYGPEGVTPFLDVVEQGMTPDLLRRLGHIRHALHAYQVRFPHPATGEPIRLQAPLPQDLRELFTRLG